MSIIRGEHNKQNPYAQISRACLQDPNLSWEAVGMLAYFISLPVDWNISVSHLVKFRDAKEHKIYRILKELMALGYCSREEIRKNGRFIHHEYIIHETPQLKDLKSPHNECEPLGDFPDVVIPILENPPTTEDISKERIDKEEIVCSAEAAVPPSDALKIPRECEKVKPDGGKFIVALDEIFTHSVMTKKNWNTLEITDAWKILCEYNAPIRAWPRFVEGTIDNLRNAKKYAPITKKTQDKQCKIINTNSSKNTSDEQKELYSASVSLIPALQSWISQNGLK
jgi:hypothetical protein